AALYLTGAARDDALTDGVELLQHIRDAFLNADSIWTTTLIERLCSREESPWLDMGRGKRLTDPVLADRLKPYPLKSRRLTISDVNRQGYVRSDFAGRWKRYLPEKASNQTSPTSPTSPTFLNNKNNSVGKVGEVGANGLEKEEKLHAVDGCNSDLKGDD